eukprot:6192432-Pyramimonas_sp.AAC.1
MWPALSHSPAGDPPPTPPRATTTTTTTTTTGGRSASAIGRIYQGAWQPVGPGNRLLLGGNTRG